MTIPVQAMARMFAAGAHYAVKQKRKYTNEDYITHPMAVAELVELHGGTDKMIAAAYLHDVVEDTGVTFDDLRKQFGAEITNMVFALTNMAKPEDGDRLKRFMINVQALRNNLDMQTRVIKLADLLHNTSSIVKHDQKFASVYLAEKVFMIDVLFDGKKIGSSEEEAERLLSTNTPHPLLEKSLYTIKKGIEALPAEMAIDTYEKIAELSMYRS
ncbi:TPA: HD domain-containing protein [Raoultella ornithinolytica]